ncbi:hypothetical protein ABW16_21630 [Mycolicibacter heraklionensis]|uniref:DUF1876 domain-containing protein n=1 Tax=Mycolicibacter heraklionensis TaxID=512402 RepID=A0ABR5FA41_9MYCO|nr:hypothetical protein [Mycolicibacter heraklionensis]KLO25912.1 hypothetical protein ABW16_21630 [Mycolicibacter heraklionensis]
MFAVTTDHQIVPFSDDQMALFDAKTGNRIALAVRESEAWTVSADGIDDRSAEDRPAAITALLDAAIEALGGTGYSTMVPHGLAEQP